MINEKLSTDILATVLFAPWSAVISPNTTTRIPFDVRPGGLEYIHEDLGMTWPSPCGSISIKLVKNE